MKLLGAVAVRGVIADLLDRFARDEGHPVQADYDLNPAIPKRLVAGEAFDVATVNPWYLAGLVAAGCLDEGVARPLGRIPLAVGGRAGDNRTGNLLDLLRDGGRIAYTGEGTSGQIFLAILDRLGLQSVTDRSVPMGAGQPVRAVAAGEADLAIAPLTVVLATEGVVPLAQFPADLGGDIAMSVCPTRAAADPIPARRLAEFLAGSDLDTMLATRGLLRG